MNKQEIISALAEELNVSKKEAERIFNAGVEVFKRALTEKKGVSLTNLFNITIKHNPSKEVTVPSTGEKVMSRAKNVLKIKAGKVISDLINSDLN